MGDFSNLFNSIVKKVSKEAKEVVNEVKDEAQKGITKAKTEIDKSVNKENYTKTERFTYNKILSSADEITPEKMQNPMETAGLVVHALCAYNPQNVDVCFSMIKKLLGEAQELSSLLRQQINDRMMQNEQWAYLGKSYFVGSKYTNDYKPDEPLTIEVKSGPYSYDNEGYATLFIHSGGADSDRQVTFRKMKDGRWVLWSDSILGLLPGIRKPESENPWA